MKDYEDMSAAELENLLAQQKEELEEIEHEKMYVMGQTGYHLSGGARKKYEAEVEEINKRINRIEEVLRQKA